MGFVLSVLYLVTAYLGPVTIFGPLAAAHIGLILAGLVMFVSLPSLQGALIWKTPQSLALVGLAFAVLLSVLMTGWITGSFQSFLDFIPNAFAYFIVCLHFNSKKKLQVLVLMLLLVCLFVTTRGYIDLQRQAASDPAAQPDLNDNAEGSYLLAQKSDAGQWFYRIRGQDFIADPNDFAQVIVCTTPLVFIFWRPKKYFRNLVCVFLPVCALLWGAFLTHSRGSVLAFLGVTIVGVRKKIGTIPAILAAIILFIGASALNYTGGRNISVDSGEDRTTLWGESLELLKSHPLVGVGYGNLPDYIGHTAHNSVAVCAAELGLVGLYFWSLFLFATSRDVLTLASPAKVEEGKPITPEQQLFPGPPATIEAFDKSDVNRIGRLLFLSLTGFLIAGWFLSRAFTMTLFLLGGMVEVVYEMALRQEMISPRLPAARMFRYAGGLMISLLVLMDIMLRTVNLMH